MPNKRRFVNAMPPTGCAIWLAAFCSMLIGCRPGVAPENGDPAADAWRTLAIADVEAIRAAVRDIHPGYRDPETPDFADRVAAAYGEARRKAGQAESFLDWRSATLGFMLSFRDGHAIYRLNAAPTRVRWPGFLLDAQGGHYVVRKPLLSRDSGPDVPQGARVMSCDGIDIDTLLRERLDGTEADWSKPSERIRHAYKLLIDYRADSAVPVSTCRIAWEDVETEVELAWQTDLWSELAPALGVFSREVERPVALRMLPSGAYWLTLGSFGDEGGLMRLAEALEADLDRLRSSAFIVLDLRGNRGGNSGWGTTLAGLIYGESAVASHLARRDARSPPRHGKFWRATPAAAAQARATAKRFAQMGPEMAGPAEYFDDVAALIDSAPSGDRALVKDPWSSPEPSDQPQSAQIAPAFTQPVYLLTDAGCFSSCVLALDPLRAMGAVVVGETTGQNAEYGEVAGPLTTPSGLGRYLIPMSVIRQRPETLIVVPDRVWSGAMDDDAGITAWIEGMSP